MGAIIITSAVGILICILGIINMTGNISSLHRYHRQRVTEEDKKPFGKLVGLGTLIIGISIIAFSALMLAFEKTQNGLYTIIGMAAIIAGLIIGMILSFYAMIKYNKGIF